MISNLAEKFAGKLFKEEVITSEEKEIYSYGFFMLFSTLVFFALALFFGLILGIPAESAVFYLVFNLLRSFAGGIHAAKESACAILTTLSIILSLMAIKLLSLIEGITISIFLLIYGFIFIFLFSPLDNNAKKLTAEEKKEYRKKSQISVSVTTVLAFMLLSFKAVSFFNSCAVGIALEAVLLTIGKIYSLRKDKSF